MIPFRTSAIACAALLGAGALLTSLGHPDRDVSLTSAGELWAELFRDADQFGLQLSRVSAKEEIDLGNKIASGILGYAQTSQQWETYVNEVGQRLAKEVSRKDIPYTFHVIREPVENAFALPGGQIFVYEGLLLRMQSEAELAGVLGHEIAHVDARHCIERYQYQLRLKHIGLEDLKLLVNIAQGIIAVNYAQYQELEADSAGLRMATAAGYDPNGITDLFTRVFLLQRPPQAQPALLENLVHLSVSVLTDYFRSHPLTEERVRRLKGWQAAYLRAHKGQTAYRGSENYRRQISRQQQEFNGEFVKL